MNGTGLPRRVHDGVVRRYGLAAGGLGLAAVLTAAAPGSSAHQGAALTASRPDAVTARFNYLTGVSAVSSSGAWAVGDNPGLVLHWTGTRWAQTPIPHPASSALESVSALPAGGAWAVGARGLLRTTTLALHWNGTAWSPVATPSPGKYSQLTSVSAVSPADAFAVGFNPGLALHWTGTGWAQTPIPHPASSALYGVSALSASNAWAVGTLSGKTLVLHWNGTAWTRVPSPNVNGNGELSGVAALPAGDAWAVGDYTAGKAEKTLVLHWNGTTWTRVPSPSPGKSPVKDSLAGVSALSAGNAWAVGRAGGKTLALHWNGTTWTRIPSPSPRGQGIGPFTVLTGVSAVSPTDAWAVGCACTSDVDITLVLHWNGKTWTRS